MGKRIYLALVLLLVPLMLLTACDGQSTTTTTTSTTSTTSTTTTTTTHAVFTLSSTSFTNGGAIPVEFSWDGGNKSPQLSWSGAPQGTVSFALIVFDLDAHNPEETEFFCHWIVFNIPATVFSLAENQPAAGTLANGALQGMNFFSTMGYGGPAPPPGETHNYRFRLYALDATFNLTAGAERDEVIEAIEGHILGQADYMGTYTSFS